MDEQEFDVELEMNEELVALNQPKPVVHGFDTAALFLLDLHWTNLFEEVTARGGTIPRYRCKGCRTILGPNDRKRHYTNHRKQRNAGRYNAPGGATMATDAKSKKPVKVTAKDQGFPSEYLAENGNFKPGLDARAKSDLVCAWLEIENPKALHTFTKEEAKKLLDARNWMVHVEKKQAAIANAEERKQRAAAKRAEQAKNSATAKKTTGNGGSNEVTPDPKPEKKQKSGGRRKPVGAATG